MRLREVVALAMLSTSAWSGSAGAAVVASWLPESPTPLVGFGDFTSYGNYVGGQSFTTTAGGTLEGISVLLSQNEGPTPSNIFVDLYSTSAGMPDDLLGTANIGSPSLPVYSSPTFFSADFSSNAIALTAGATYAFLLRTTDGNAAAAGSLLSPGDGYLAGTLFSSIADPVLPGGLSDNDGYDLSFSISATPVPLPAAGWLLLSGLAGLGIAGRRRARS